MLSRLVKTAVSSNGYIQKSAVGTVLGSNNAAKNILGVFSQSYAQKKSSKYYLIISVALI
jgi:hypothetical protein